MKLLFENSTKTIRLFAHDLYEVIVDLEGGGGDS